MFSTVKRIHFVGIGGIGMSGIAEILINQGFSVSGSDLSQSENTDYLKNLSATIYIGHTSQNIAGAEVVVYSSAVDPAANPETVEATRQNIPLIRRAEMLAEVSRLNYCLAIAGTHGKTTTTSLCGLILKYSGFDPTVIVGGRLREFGGSNARLGKGKWTVVEADEYDRSFLQLMPTIAVVNNIEPEHLDIYKDFDDLKATFTQFANKVPFYGLVAVGLDCQGVKEIYSGINKKIVSFGLSRNCDIMAENIQQIENSTTFDVFEIGEKAGKVTINIPGIHNVKNSLAAIAVCRQLGIRFEIICDALSEFHGVYRRFDIKGSYRGALVVDDYAHHPSEVRATLLAARAGWKRRIVCVFQPHTYTRTRDFYKEFGQSFDNADILIVTDVYPAREKPIDGVTGKLVADAAIQSGHKSVYYLPTLEAALDELYNIIGENDLVITLGAGNVNKIAEELLQ